MVDEKKPTKVDRGDREQEEGEEKRLRNGNGNGNYKRIKIQNCGNMGSNQNAE